MSRNKICCSGLAGVVLSGLLCLGLLLPGATALAQPAPPPQELKPIELPKPTTVPKRAMSFVPDTLLVMVNQGADREEVATALREAHGTVIGSAGEGSMTTLLIQTEKGKLDEVEKSLSKDSDHFSLVQRNLVSEAHMFASGVPNDPYFASGWHLSALNVPKAWSVSSGNRIIIGVADTGSQSTNPDLSGRTYRGVDLVQSGSYGSVDRQLDGSHGTAVATTAAASTNNRMLTASPAYGSYIYPLRISYPIGGKFYTQDYYVIKAIEECAKNGVRIINVSYGTDNSQYSYANPATHPALHSWLKWYHDQKNGLAIFSAGNGTRDSAGNSVRVYDSNARLPYMIVVSALDDTYGLASFSTYGQPVWFTAPGTKIACSDRNGKFIQVPGTSFSAPLIASLCAMILSRNPSMKNTEVERRLVQSCRNIAGSTWNPYFGFGLPDAAYAVGAPGSSRALEEDDWGGDSGAEGEPAQPVTPEGPSWSLDAAPEPAELNDGGSGKPEEAISREEGGKSAPTEAAGAGSTTAAQENQVPPGGKEAGDSAGASSGDHSVEP